MVEVQVATGVQRLRESRQQREKEQRLRDSLKQHGEDMRCRGREAGAAWAEDTSEYKELSSLASHKPYNESWTHQFCLFIKCGNRGIGQGLFAIIRPDDHNGDDFNTIRAFWQTAIGDDADQIIEHIRFAEGFVEGAIGYWTENKEAIHE